MYSLIFSLVRLMRAISRAARDAEFRALCAVALVLLLAGTLFYVRVEDWGYIDAAYFCVMTMATIGYGDLTPTSDVSKLFTIIYSLLSIGVFVGVASKLAAAMLQQPRRHTDDGTVDPPVRSEAGNG